MAQANFNDDGEFIRVGPKELASILEGHCMEGESVGIIGMPGVGKTEIPMAVAAKCGKPMLSPFNTVTSDGTDFKGIPSFSEDRLSVNWIKDARWLNAVQMPTTILLDEFPQGNMGSMNAGASIIWEKRIDDLYLHPDTWVVWTGNRAQDKCGTTRVPSHINDRCYKYELTLSAQDHVEYEISNPDVDMLTLRFLRMKGDTAYTFDPALVVNASPRAWSEIARRLFKYPATPMPTIAGRIGRGLASELMAFRSLAPTLPTPEEVILNPTGARVPENTSAQFLVTDMLADRATAGNFDALVEYAKRLPPEMQAKFVKDSMVRKPEVAATTAFVKWGVKFSEVLR